jgi:hypothetical protein
MKQNKNGNVSSVAGFDNSTNQFTVENHTTTQNQNQYLCSFCWRELPDNGLRFAGFGVCPLHLKLAEIIVDALRRHQARHFNLGGAK